MTEESMTISAVTPDQAAKLFSAASSRRVSAEQVRAIAEEGELLRADGTFNVIEYTAYLAHEVHNG